MSCFHRALIAVAPCVILLSHHRCDGDFGTSPRENFLVADYSISCNSPSYRGFFFPWAVMMSLVYPVGVPLLYTCLLLPHRKALEQDRTAALASMGSSILVQEFKSQFWYWESIDSIRRVALSGFLVFFGERARVGVAFCIALGFQLLYLETKPFARRESNLLASLANFEISAVVLLLLNTQARSVKGGDVAGSFCIFVNLLLVPPLLVIQVYRTYQRQSVMRTLSSFPLLGAKEQEERHLPSPFLFSQRDAIVEILATGQKNRMLLLHKIFDWLSQWTLEFPITDQKWQQLLFVLDLLSEEDSDITLGICFVIDNQEVYASATPAAVGKLSEPNVHIVRYTSCSRPDERAVVNEEERTILLENSPEPIPYEVRRDHPKDTITQPLIDSPRSYPVR